MTLYLGEAKVSNARINKKWMKLNTLYSNTFEIFQKTYLSIRFFLELYDMRSLKDLQCNA